MKYKIIPKIKPSKPLLIPGYVSTSAISLCDPYKQPEVLNNDKIIAVNY
jgi:hypothetical protein